MTLRFVLACLLAVLATAAHAQQGTRKVALVVANGNYANAGILPNPQSDGALVAAAARRAGFDSVTVASDVDLANFQRALRTFREQSAGAQVALVYYAGHGIEGQGRNWLIPTDARLSSALDLPYEAVELDRVLEAVSGARIRIVVLDACRNNPFGRTWQSGSRGVPRGLGGVEVDDVLVIYAAAPGQTANDGAGPNSPFAASFARRLVQPGLPVQLLGGAVRDDVLASTGGAQRPYVSASITGTPVYLLGPTTAATPLPPPIGPTAVPVEAPSAQTRETAGCGADLTLRICIRSAAISGGYGVRASVVLEVSNISDHAIDIAFVDYWPIWSFTPQNGETIAGSVTIAGVSTCSPCESTTNPSQNSARYTTLAPGLSARASVAIAGYGNERAASQLPPGSTASLSGQVFVIERGVRRYVPLTIGEFGFGNGLAGH
jgi:hypothetical protein